MNGKQLNAEPRELTGKNNNNRLRSDGFIPAVLYSHGQSEAIKVKEKDFAHLFKGGISESVIFSIDIAGKTSGEDMAFIKDFQRDPVTGAIIHLDFFKVTRGEKIKTNIPVELIGTPVGIKMGGIFKHGERELFVQCMPRHLPEKIEVDITGLQPGDSIHVGQIKVSDDIEILTSPDNIIAAVDRPRATSADDAEAAAESADEAAEASGEE